MGRHKAYECTLNAKSKQSPYENGGRGRRHKKPSIPMLNVKRSPID